MLTFTVSYLNALYSSLRSNELEHIISLMKYLQRRFSEESKTYIVYICVCLQAIFFLAFVGTLLHYLASYRCKQSISGTV